MIIIDASVAIKWINKEIYSELAFSLLNKHIAGDQKIIVPGFLFIEVANALGTKSRSSEKDISEGLQFLFASNLHIYELINEDIIQAARKAKQYKTSVYDMLYAVIADKKNSLLITADEKFAQKVNLPFVKILGNQL